MDNTLKWIKAEINFASTFSYRMPDTSSQFAVPMLLPGPSTIKLALVATAIVMSGKIEEGESIFEAVKEAKIKFLLPERISVFRPLIKRLKPKSAALKIKEFESTFGTRGYVLYSNPIILYLGLSPKYTDKVIHTIKHLRRLGTSDSLLTVFNVYEEIPPKTSLLVEPLDTLEDIKNGRLIQKVKDIKSSASFKDVNPFEKSKTNPFLTKFYLLPIKSVKEGKNWTIYERF